MTHPAAAHRKATHRRRRARVSRTEAHAALALAAAFLAACGEHQGPGTIQGERLPEATIAAREAATRRTADALAAEAGEPEPARQILFGDLHVHTVFSADAFAMGMPILQGEGAHPLADACDFARYCSGLDFWSITDHAEALTPRRWRETKESIRQCNELAGDPADPDVAAFLGWEWTQVGQTPEDHWGHKNVIFRDLADDRVPARPIHSAALAASAMRQRPPSRMRYLLPLADWPNRQYYWNLFTFQQELRDAPDCPAGVDTRELPEDCVEGAPTPEVLFEKLSQWGFDTLVIPHGTTWGIYTPQGSSWEKQLTPTQHDPAKQTLIEVFSGHGNSEEYRPWRAVEVDAAGRRICPEPSADYEPCCWRAGEIVRSHCEDPASPACERKVEEARRNALAAGVRERLTLPGVPVDAWGNCGQCPDCTLPSFNYRPGGSVQYILSLSDFEAGGSGAPPPDDAEREAPQGGDDADAHRFRFGFIASSDNHTARPGTGYKEYGRMYMTEARGARDATWYGRLAAYADREPATESVPFDADTTELLAFQMLDFERQASFFMTGGLVAAHSEGRSREAIWRALKERRVYATSGERILLWFDLLNAPGGATPMGSEVTMTGPPRFRVRAAGAFEQKPGCPPVSRNGLAPDRLERLCRGECYHPGDARHPIERIEVVRIRPQRYEGEPVAPLIDDPWRVLPCPGRGEGCVVEFEDEEFVAGGRESVYYVRALQEETLAVNAGGLRCASWDEAGICAEVEPCYGDYRTPFDDDCLAPTRERAWSSPIYVSPP